MSATLWMIKTAGPTAYDTLNTWWWHLYPSQLGTTLAHTLTPVSLLTTHHFSAVSLTLLYNPFPLYFNNRENISRWKSNIQVLQLLYRLQKSKAVKISFFLFSGEFNQMTHVKEKRDLRTFAKSCSRPDIDAAAVLEQHFFDTIYFKSHTCSCLLSNITAK